MQESAKRGRRPPWGGTEDQSPCPAFQASTRSKKAAIAAGGIKWEGRVPAQAERLACHGGSYAALAKKTEKVTPNPHYNHFGDRDCDTCHRVWEQPVLSCDECHKFKTLRMPFSQK